MGKKYRRYKNAVEKYLSSEKGRRFFHITYSVGAAIVIVGALFKINHFRFGTEILFIGMVTEAFIFAISAFDRPSKDYKWEEVFPELGSEPDRRESAHSEHSATSVPRTHASNRGGGGGGTVIIGGTAGGSSSGNAAAGNVAAATGTVSGGVVGGVIGGGFIGGSGSLVTDAGNAVEASEKYAEQLSKASENMEKFAQVTNSLAEMSNMLLSSFQSITDNSEGLGNNTKGYVTQMEALNRNISGLNTIYEIQLKGVSGQINTIEQINAGLDRIKKLYDGSMADSAIFKTETEKMAQQLAELNRVYARLLQAMTVNMNMSMGAGFNNPGMQNPNPQQGDIK